MKSSNIRRNMDKSEGRMCMELVNPVAIVRELSIKRERKGSLQKIDYKAFIRAASLMIWLILFGVITYLYSDGSPLRTKLLISNPIVIILGWYIIGGKGFTRASIRQIDSSYKEFKLTILHSIFLVMAMLSFSLVTKVVMNGGVMIMVESGPLVDFNETVLKVLFMFVMVAALVIGYSIYQYRVYSNYYYSIICHGTGFIGMMLSYINVINHFETTRPYFNIIFHCEWVYIQSLIFTGAFFVYCSVKSEV